MNPLILFFFLNLKQMFILAASNIKSIKFKAGEWLELAFYCCSVWNSAGCYFISCNQQIKKRKYEGKPFAGLFYTDNYSDFIRPVFLYIKSAHSSKCKNTFHWRFYNFSARADALPLPAGAFPGKAGL
jgi:hypothetical protein